MKTATWVRAAPRASILIESMRDVGYTLETALADVIDNAIAAGAKSIRLLADTNAPEPRLAILDDGHGMVAHELLDAMRLGSQSPLDPRESGDLGRFGLGLKTASFSQCRRLTVLTKAEGKMSAARWDLAQVEESDDWLVEIPPDPSTIPFAKELGENGTLVLWEKLDRLLAGGSADEEGRHLVKRLDDAAVHLELVFHRFLSGERGLKRVAISLNGRPLEPFDPFHASHSATIAGPIETIRIGRHHVTLQTFTLPHHKKVALADWDRYGGPAGYVKNQGFYLYRAKRLIIHGTWFGIARQTELTKLTRVRIDMPNSVDAEWKVDIKKASAQPPPQVLIRLRHLIETIGATSKRVYTSRGRRLTDNRLRMWHRVQDKNEIRYGINAQHPVVADFADRLPALLRPDFLHVMEMVGASIPVDALFADISGHPTDVAGSAMSPEALEHAVVTTLRQLLKSGISRIGAADLLQVTEPFRSNWKVTEKILQMAAEGESLSE